MEHFVAVLVDELVGEIHSDKEGYVDIREGRGNVVLHDVLIDHGVTYANNLIVFVENRAEDAGKGNDALVGENLEVGPGSVGSLEDDLFVAVGVLNLFGERKVDGVDHFGHYLRVVDGHFEGSSLFALYERNGCRDRDYGGSVGAILVENDGIELDGEVVAVLVTVDYICQLGGFGLDIKLRALGSGEVHTVAGEAGIRLGLNLVGAAPGSKGYDSPYEQACYFMKFHIVRLIGVDD